MVIHRGPRAAPPQSPRAEPFLDLVGHVIRPPLFDSLLAIEEHALNLPGVVQSADTHAHQSHG